MISLEESTKNHLISVSNQNVPMKTITKKELADKLGSPNLTVVNVLATTKPAGADKAYEGGLKEWAEAGLPMEGKLTPQQYLAEKYKEPEPMAATAS